MSGAYNMTEASTEKLIHLWMSYVILGRLNRFLGYGASDIAFKKHH